MQIGEHRVQLSGVAWRSRAASVTPVPPGVNLACKPGAQTGNRILPLKLTKLLRYSILSRDFPVMSTKRDRSMRLTTKGRYAVTALLDLAIHADTGPVNLADISQRQGISLSYLEQLFAKLRRCELVS